jgi:hypothetical protein
MVQQAINGVLCHYSQCQGKHPEGRSRISIQASLMHYINDWLRNWNVFPSTKYWSRMQKPVRSGVFFQEDESQCYSSMLAIQKQNWMFCSNYVVRI